MGITEEHVFEPAGCGDDRMGALFRAAVGDTKTVHCQASCWMPLASFSLEKGRHWRIVQQ